MHTIIINPLSQNPHSSITTNRQSQSSVPRPSLRSPSRRPTSIDQSLQAALRRHPPAHPCSRSVTPRHRHILLIPAMHRRRRHRRRRNLSRPHSRQQHRRIDRPAGAFSTQRLRSRRRAQTPSTSPRPVTQTRRRRAIPRAPIIRPQAPRGPFRGAEGFAGGAARAVAGVYGAQVEVCGGAGALEDRGC